MSTDAAASAAVPPGLPIYPEVPEVNGEYDGELSDQEQTAAPWTHFLVLISLLYIVVLCMHCQTSELRITDWLIRSFICLCASHF